MRICGDYKVTINGVLDVEQYPLPLPDDMFATLAGRKHFSKLDLTQAYNQTLVDEDTQKLLTINTHRGLYQYKRLPFSIASAPAIFQRVMDTLLQDIPHTLTFTFQHSIGSCHLSESHGYSPPGYPTHLVLHRCHRIDAEGRHATDDKLQAIVNQWNIHELRSFLGLLNYYNKFMPNLASVVRPMYDLLHENKKWEWSAQCTESFKRAKDLLISPNVLVHYDPNLPIKLAADASSYGVGAVISHVMPDNSEKPIAFASHTLTKSERNYSQLEKEALGLIFGVKKFHTYLYGRKFVLVSDHKPLTTILGPYKGVPTIAAAKLQRWALILSGYHYEIEFRPTKAHANADGLSRLPLPSDTQEIASIEPNIF